MFITKTLQAEEDLIEIWTYIAQDNIIAADNLLYEIEKQFNILLDNPFIGQLGNDIASELRHFTIGRYLILYRASSSNIQIVRVVHGARNLTNLV